MTWPGGVSVTPIESVTVSPSPSTSSIGTSKLTDPTVGTEAPNWPTWNGLTRDVGVFQTVVAVGGEDADLCTGHHAADIDGSIALAR